MRLILLGVAALLIASCGSRDKELIIGKWDNEQHWFEFHNETEYSGGVGPVVNEKKQSYVIEPSANKLTFYTGNKEQTYYLRYELIGTDTLSISNFMNKTSQAVKYYRTNGQ